MKKILLIGDSIRQGYDKYVKLAFANVADVRFPADNCRFSAYTLRRLYDWKNELECDESLDLVHWNAGLWDVLRMEDGRCLIPIEAYKDNIDRICTLLDMYYPYAKKIFATSTPVQEHLFGKLKRINADTEAYNAAAAEIVRSYGGEVNDLYALMNGCPDEYHSDGTHFYTKDGTRVITDKVVETIENSLGIKAEKLDYDALFADAENVIGI